MKKRLIFLGLTLLFLLLNAPHTFAQETEAIIKVACVGNSITEGLGLDKTYPQVLQELLGEQYEVRNYGISGRTLLKKGDYPYWNEAKYEDVLDWNPDIVIIMLGTNDTKPQNWQYKEEYVGDYMTFINSFKKLSSRPEVLVCNPIPVFEDKFDINGVAMKKEVLPKMKKIAQKTKVQIIDLNTPFIGKAALTYDGVHPNDEGAGFLATEVYKALKTADVIFE